jgi:SAM-dependent methyltransferase
LDETKRERALEALRTENAGIVLRAIAEVRPGAPGTLLDAGCGHGHFMDVATRKGIAVTGVEPDIAVAAGVQTRGHRVLVGLFPEAVSAEELWDVVSFNDVLEHIPDPAQGVRDARAHLTPGGVVSIAIPTTAGLVFRLAQRLRTFGVRGPWNRLWQYGLPSPHLWYFDESSLTTLLDRNGFDVVVSRRLRSVSRHGLWARLHFDRRPGPTTLVAFLALALAAAFLNGGRSDAMLLVGRAR